MIESAKFVAAALCVLGLAVVAAAPAHAQAPSLTKQCGQKWAAAKAAGNTEGLTWPKFLSRCRAEAAAEPAATPVKVAPEPAAAHAKAAAATPAAGNAVFPAAVSSKYAHESPGRARLHSCLDQYRANKATNSNGGLKWIQKGGGYWSECTKRLKG